MIDLARAVPALEKMARLLGIGAKSAASVAQDFQDELTDLLDGYWAGHAEISAEDMRTMVQQAIQNAYQEALDADAGDLTDEDRQAIDELYGDQEDFVAGFVADARGAKKEPDLRAAILARLALWGAAIAAVGFVAQAINAPDERVTWRLGRTEEHCDTCRRLDGQTHSRDWFYIRGYSPATPGAAMTCGGWNCDCRFE